MTLGARIKQMRENLGMNQKQLAKASNIYQVAISRIESGEAKELKSEVLKRIAKALGVTMDYLVGKTDKVTPDDIVRSDPIAQQIFRDYEKLSASGREQVKNFVRFLEEQEVKKEREKR